MRTLIPRSPRALLFWMFVILCVRRIPSLIVPIWTKDEGYWWAVGHAVAQGGPLYRAAADNKPPFFLYAYGLAIHWFGPYAFFALHLLVTLGIGLVLYLLYRIGRQMYGESIGLVMAGSFLVLQGAFVSQEVLAANSENLMLPWMVAAIFTYLRYRHHGKMTNLLWSGILLGIAFHIRQTALFMLMALLVHTAFASRRIPVWLRDTSLLCIGFGGILAAVMAGFAVSGTFADFWFWTVTLTLHYVEEPIRVATVLWDAFWKTGTVMLAGCTIWYLAGQALRYWRQLCSEGLLWLLTTFAMCLAVVAGWRFSHHYYVQLFPIIAILAGWTVAQRKRHGASAWRLPRSLLPALVAVSYLGFTVEGYYWWYVDRTGGSRPAMREAGKSIAAHAAPTDTLFIWGYYPEIYYYAGLSNATRFLETHFLTGQIRDRTTDGGLPEAHTKLWRWLNDDLSERPPTWIVDTSGYPVSGRYLHPLSKYPDMAAYVERNYRKFTTIAGVPVFRRIAVP